MGPAHEIVGFFHHLFIYLFLFLFFGGLAHESAVNRVSTSLIALSIVRSADCDSKDKNLVGSLDRFAKTAGLARFGRFDFNLCVPLFVKDFRSHGKLRFFSGPTSVL